MPFAVSIRLAGVLTLVALVTAPLFSQEPTGERLIDQPAFDLLTLDKINDSKVLKIYPVKLPGRRVPEKPKGSDLLRIKLLDDGEEYEVAWVNIAKLEFFEGMVLAEANRRTLDGKFDEAYEYFVFLYDFYPHTPGLAEGRQNYLYHSAGAAFRQQKYEEALGVLEELLALNRNFRAGGSSPTLMQVLGSIADPLLAGYIGRQDFNAARILLTRLARQYKADEEPFVVRWRQQMIDLAAKQRDLAKEHIAAGRFREAHDACRAMQNIWPDLPGAGELVAEVARLHPLVAVGVESPALTFDSRSLHNVAARRAGRLTERLLVELSGLGPEGGKYETPLGTVSRSEDGLALIFRLPTKGAGEESLDLLQQLLARAEPGSAAYLPAWARIVSSVGFQSAGEIEVKLRQAHVLPQALLRSPLVAPAGADRPSPAAPFVVFSRDVGATRFTLNPNYEFRRAGQPAEIVERHIDDPALAILALKQGEIDALDRVFPGDIGLLEADANLVVAPYQAPTTHVLAVRSANPFLANATFRRALLFGCNRELLLQQGILRGKARPGFRVVSGPFPASAAVGDLTSYGYDPRIEPRSYDPRLALTLRVLAENEVKAQQQRAKAEPPKLGELVLGHAADEMSRIACRGLVRQWKLIGVECKLIEFAPGIFDDAEHACDLVYLQLAAWEPVVDAGRLLGTGGLIPAGSAFIQQALRQIEAARNWREARERLLQLHRLIHEDVTLLPLWQTLDHFAYRKRLAGIGASPMRLYQDVERWRAAAQAAGAKP